MRVGIWRCEAKPLAPPLPARGERSDSERGEGIRVRGHSRESEAVDKPPHPICFAALALRLQIDLSPHAGRGGASGATRGSGSHALRHLAQLEFLDLSGRGFWDLVEHHVARGFVAREVLFAPREELVRAGLGAGLELDEGARGLAPLL